VAADETVAGSGPIDEAAVDQLATGLFSILSIGRAADERLAGSSLIGPAAGGTIGTRVGVPGHVPARAVDRD
jgi:hypothetical protein